MTVKADAAVEEFYRLVGTRFFGATFLNAEGEERRGIYRCGIRVRDAEGRLNGGERSRSRLAARRGNAIVYDVRKREYRTIKLERLRSLRICGEEIRIGDGK